VSEVRLDGALSVDYDVCWEDVDGNERHRTVQVNFPDEARSILASLPWREGLRVVDLISELGSVYVMRSIAARVAGEPFPHNGSEAATIDVPHESFHAAIRTMGFHDSAP
jgi:hypothetical protein